MQNVLICPPITIDLPYCPTIFTQYGKCRHFSANEQRSSSKMKHREKGIWQRRYWEHQIRDDVDLQRHVDYIHYNPVKHGLVSNVKDWPHSTFHKHVAQGTVDENWGSYDEKGVFGE